jgi:hypothetical protein
MSSKARRAVILGSTLFLLLLLIQFLPKWLASWTASQVTRAIGQSFSSAARVSVKVGQGSLMLWSRGQLKDLKIEAKGLETKDGFPMAAFFFEARQLTVDLGKLIRQGKVELLSTHDAKATVVLAEKELTGYLQKHLDKSLENVRMELRSGKATVYATATLLGQKVRLTIAGKFAPHEGQLRFLPTDFSVAQVQIPRFLLTGLARQVEFIVPLGKLPLPMELESVRIENGNAYLAGRGELQ